MTVRLPALTASAAVLLVRDVVASAGHYRDRLGFVFERFYGDPPGFVILYRDEVFLMLKQAVDPADIRPLAEIPTIGLWNAYFWVSNVDALHADVAARGAVIAYGPSDQAYGCREFGIRDPDGYSIGFGEIVSP